jgi:hypothetical protein
MTRSLYSGWVDREFQQEDRSDTMSAILAACVWDMQNCTRKGHPLIGNPQPSEVFAVMFMALMFSPTQETAQAARSVIRHFSERHAQAYQLFRQGFQRVQAANLVNDGSQDVTKRDVAKLRHKMMQAVEAMR